MYHFTYPFLLFALLRRVKGLVDWFYIYDIIFDRIFWTYNAAQLENQLRHRNQE